MELLQYAIDGKIHEVSVNGSPEFSVGKNETLSGKGTDITFEQPWYNDGFASLELFSEEEFNDLQSGLTQCISNILQRENIDTYGFELKNYHQFVKTDETHFKVVGVTRDLFPADFNFPIKKMHKKLGELLGFELSDIEPANGEPLHIIVRINRPFSTDYNPPHKDIYEAVDNEGRIPLFVNFWIPVCGVTEKSSLPIAPKSHLIPENKVERTYDGGVVAGKKYRVRSIKSWNGDSQLERAKIKNGQVLIFSSHLIHGLAINEENQTRVALEFRLFKK